MLKRRLRLRRPRVVRGIVAASAALARAEVVGVVEGRLLCAAACTPVTRVAAEHVVATLGGVGSVVAGSELLRWLLVVVTIVAIAVVVVGCASVGIPRHDALIDQVVKKVTTHHALTLIVSKILSHMKCFSEQSNS